MLLENLYLQLALNFGRLSHLQQLAIATALNVTRLAAWSEQKTRETTRQSPLFKLII